MSWLIEERDQTIKGEYMLLTSLKRGIGIGGRRGGLGLAYLAAVVDEITGEGGITVTDEILIVGICERHVGWGPDYIL